MSKSKVRLLFVIALACTQIALIEQITTYKMTHTRLIFTMLVSNTSSIDVFRKAVHVYQHQWKAYIDCVLLIQNSY